MNEYHDIRSSLRQQRRSERILNFFDNIPTQSIRRASSQYHETLFGGACELMKDSHIITQVCKNYFRLITGNESNFTGNWYMNAVERDNHFSSRILWTNEAIFTRQGIFNSYNSHVWTHNNPYASRQRNFQRISM